MTDLKQAPSRPFRFVALEAFEWKVPAGINKYLQEKIYTVRPGEAHNSLEDMVLQAEADGKVMIERSSGDNADGNTPLSVVASPATVAGTGTVR